MASRFRSEHYAKRDRRHATWSYRERKTQTEIAHRIAAFGKRHRLQTRALIRRFYQATEIEMLRWLECERKRRYLTPESADQARRATPDGHRMRVFPCSWADDHFHFGHSKEVARRETREVQMIRELIEYRRGLLQKAS